MKKTTKKKSAREKRVLIGALCVAAVMIAGSTFAWFTSQDEVTNRLSANADYNVSIVESFTPPNNWIPGQEVKKDVYATNTGNIGAYVEEDVSGVLTITKEVSAATWDSDCVELTTEERYVMEAGSYLALAPAGSTAVVGNQVVIRPGDQTTPAATEFTPDVDGLYVFRRSIGVDATTHAETFEYEGYYYKNGKYYKVNLTSVSADGVADFAADGNSADGNLTDATATYFKGTTETVKPVNLEYDATNNRLVATYDTGITSADNLVALAQAYDSAIEDYERAAEAVARATNDSAGTNTTLATQKTALDAAWAELQTALATQSEKAIALANATTTLTNATAAKNAAQTAVTNSQNLLYGDGGTEAAPLTGSLKKAYDDAHSDLVTTNGRDQFLSDFATWAASADNTTGNAATTPETYTYEQFSTFPKTAQNQEYYTKLAEEKRAKEAYEAELIKLHGSTDTTAAATPDSLEGKLATATAAETAATTAKNTAQNDMNAADAAATTKQTAYDDALAAYNAAATADGQNTTDLANANAALAAAAAAKNAAEEAYNAANSGTPSDGVLKININLSDNVVTAGGVADKWQLLPTTIGADNTAKFFYTSILPGGTTSTKLIESVELDSSATQDMYKAFDFDINVALKSAQIAYDSDNTTLLTTPANEELDANARLAQPTSEATPITWTAKP